MTKYSYSPAEDVLLKLLPSNGSTIGSAKLAERYYSRIKKEMPFHGRIFVNTTMRSLSAKVKANHEPFKIMRERDESSGGQGRRPYIYWRE